MSDYPELTHFTKSISIDALDGEEKSYALQLEQNEFDLIATFLETPEVKALSGDVRVVRHRDLITVRGNIRAHLVRECVATLDPLDEAVDEDFVATFTTEKAPENLVGEIQADLDAPEYVEGDHLDLAHVLLEQLVLAMDPHPRKAGVDALADPGAGARITPFDVLKDLKKQ